MVVLIGLPCNISSVMTVLENKGIAHENLVTIDLVCGGDTPASVGEQYIEYLERKFRSNVVEFSVRYKNPNWAPAHLRAVFENGKVFCKEFYSTEYGYAFDHMKREACYCCRFKGENHYSDITIGDGWGVCEKDRGYNAKGVSVAFVHSEAGNRILNELQDIELFEAESNEMERNNPRYLTPKPKLQKDEQFRAAFQKYGLFRACKKAYGYKYRIMRVMPDGVMEYCRRIKHRMEILRK